MMVALNYRAKITTWRPRMANLTLKAAGPEAPRHCHLRPLPPYLKAVIPAVAEGVPFATTRVAFAESQAILETRWPHSGGDSMFAVLMTLAAITSAGATPASDQAVETALSHCLGSISAKLPTASDPTQVPPGLIEGAGVSVAPIAGEDYAFSYEGTSPRAMTCGVAIYGPVSQTMRQRITAMVQGNPAWKPHAIEAYDLSKRFTDAEESYWGDPSAPSMKGVAILLRKPSAEAPTMEIEYHAVMVQ